MYIKFLDLLRFFICFFSWHRKYKLSTKLNKNYNLYNVNDKESIIQVTLRKQFCFLKPHKISFDAQLLTILHCQLLSQSDKHTIASRYS